MVIRWDFDETEILVEGARGLHFVQGIEQNAVIGFSPGKIEDLFTQKPSYAEATILRPYEKAFHLARIHVVGLIGGPQRSATRLPKRAKGPHAAPNTLPATAQAPVRNSENTDRSSESGNTPEKSLGPKQDRSALGNRGQRPGRLTAILT